MGANLILLVMSINKKSRQAEQATLRNKFDYLFKYNFSKSFGFSFLTINHQFII
jgi:hypothetical protein